MVVIMIYIQKQIEIYTKNHYLLKDNNNYINNIIVVIMIYMQKQIEIYIKNHYLLNDIFSQKTHLYDNNTNNNSKNNNTKNKKNIY